MLEEAHLLSLQFAVNGVKSSFLQNVLSSLRDQSLLMLGRRLEDIFIRRLEDIFISAKSF